MTGAPAQARKDGAGPAVARESWRRIALAAFHGMWQHRTSLIAAGVAFYALLALFPGLAALTALYGLWFDSQQVTDQAIAVGAVLPPEALDIILRQLQGLTGTSRDTLSAGAVAALLLTWWSASRAVKTLMEALNFAYGEHERRGFFRLNGVALLMTLGLVVGACIAVSAVVAVPVVVKLFGLDPLLGDVISEARWPILGGGMALALSVLYRYGPCRRHARRSLFSWGAMSATAIWLAGSWAFSFYVESFGTFNETYGSLGAVVILLMWFLLSAYAILLGAEIDSALERQPATPDRRVYDRREPVAAPGAG